MTTEKWPAYDWMFFADRNRATHLVAEQGYLGKWFEVVERYYRERGKPEFKLEALPVTSEELGKHLNSLARHAMGIGTCAQELSHELHAGFRARVCSYLIREGAVYIPSPVIKFT